MVSKPAEGMQEARVHSRHWAETPERGNATWVAIGTYLATLFRRPLTHRLLYLVALYFFLSAPRARRHAREYLRRALPREPACARRLPPGVRLRDDDPRPAVPEPGALRVLRRLERGGSPHGGAGRARLRRLPPRRALRQLRDGGRARAPATGPEGGDGDVPGPGEPPDRALPGRPAGLRPGDHPARPAGCDAAHPRLPRAGQVRRHARRPHHRRGPGAPRQVPRHPDALSRRDPCAWPRLSGARCTS